MRYQLLCFMVILSLSAFLTGDCLGYPNDFRTFKIIPSDFHHGARTKYLSRYHSESESPIQESRNVETSESELEHRTINIMQGQQDVENVGKKSEAKLLIPYPYAYGPELDAPKSLQISVEPDKNDTKFKISDTFLDAFIKPQSPPQPQFKAPTTKRPNKKPNNNKITNKLPRPDNKPQPRPNKNIKQAPGTEEIDEDQDNTTNDPVITTQQGSVIQNNDLTGSSQIGNRESQMILKPTVIVNIRGTVTNSEGGLSLESRTGDIEMSTGEKSKTPTRNIFHISQEINFDRKPFAGNGDLSIDNTEPKEYYGRRSHPEERTIDVVLSGGKDEYRLKERMSIFDDYSDFSLY